MTCAVLATTPSISHADDINTQLNNMFGSMSNSTSGGSYESVTRQGYIGGGFVVRNQLRTISPINITPPKVSGGCAGIDFFAGSFSFINADEFVQLLRSIAANSVGLAFQLAINAMDSVLGGEISKLQALIQKLNEYSANSCQLSKGLLVDMASAFGEDAKSSVASSLSSEGLLDSFEALNADKIAKPPVVETAEKSGRINPCSHYGNLMWCALNQGGFNNNFMGSDVEQKELVMSMTGMVIVAKPTKNANNEMPFDSTKIAPIPMAEIYEMVMKGTVNGEKMEIYGCGKDTDTCANPSNKKLKIDGLEEIFLKIFQEGKFLQAYISGEKAANALLQKAHMFNVNGAVTNGYALIEGQDTTRAMHYYTSIAPIISYEAAYMYLNSMLSVAESNLGKIIPNNDNPLFKYSKLQSELIQQAKRDLNQVHNNYVIKHGGLVKVQEIFNTYMTGTSPLQMPTNVNAAKN